jgi:hypothetical protein
LKACLPAPLSLAYWMTMGKSLPSLGLFHHLQIARVVLALPTLASILTWEMEWAVGSPAGLQILQRTWRRGAA